MDARHSEHSSGDGDGTRGRPGGGRLTRWPSDIRFMIWLGDTPSRSAAWGRVSEVWARRPRRSHRRSVSASRDDRVGRAGGRAEQLGPDGGAVGDRRVGERRQQVRDLLRRPLGHHVAHPIWSRSTTPAHGCCRRGSSTPTRRPAGSTASARSSRCSRAGSCRCRPGRRPATPRSVGGPRRRRCSTATSTGSSRSTRRGGRPKPSGRRLRPKTIEETAALVDRAGSRDVAVQ